MRMDIDGAMAKLAMGRAGSFSRAEIGEAGGDRYLIRRRVRSGLWLPRGGDVFTLRGFRDSLDQRRWIGLLGAGPDAHLSHESSGELHGLAGVPPGLVVATVDHPNHLDLPGVTLHQLTDVAPHHLTEVDGFPTTTPARTIIDLASVLGPVRLRRSIEDAIARRLTTYGEIGRTLEEVRRRGKPGVRKLVLVLDQLGGEPPPASRLEAFLHEAARLAGVRIVRQHPLPTHRPIRGLVDAAVLESKLILEADGRSWHVREQSMANDRRRDRDAARLGWLTMRFMHQELTSDLAGCADDIRTTHRERSRG